MRNIFEKIRNGLEKTRSAIGESVDNVLKSFSSINDEVFYELEETLIIADIGVATATDITERLKLRAKERKLRDTAELKEELKNILVEILTDNQEGKEPGYDGLRVILIVGVNGVGKTTSIGKLASLYKEQGKSVLLAAGDTFRAAAADQLEIWAKRTGADIIRHGEGADAAAVIFDAVNAAKARKTDVLICDTAGRLHNKQNLMNELKKMARVIEREMPGARLETYLALDATTGQNAVMQAKSFGEVTNLSGIILTKLDGTAKGGIVISIARDLSVPVRYIGVGEGINDLMEFDANAFVDALF